jgi:hypothetical protein
VLAGLAVLGATGVALARRRGLSPAGTTPGSPS